jgi:hypothetical protein
MLTAGVDANGRPADAAAGAHLYIDARDAHPTMRSSLRLDEVVLAAARVLARQVGSYAISGMPYLSPKTAYAPGELV